MSTDLSKTHSSFQKKITILRKRTIVLQESLKRRKEYCINASDFIRKLLSENRITKDELKEYFPKKRNLFDSPDDK